MAYFEYLRVQRSFLIFAAVVSALCLTIYLIAIFHGAEIHIGLARHAQHAPRGISVIVFTSFAAWGTAILATIIAASLNRQRDHLAYTWTRPEDRAVMALRFIAVDIGVLLAAFVFVFVFCLIVLALVTQFAVPLLWTGIVPNALRAFGFALLWYAIVQSITAGMSVRGSLICGISWPVFIVAAGLEAARFPSPWRELLIVVNTFNPMAYLSGTQVNRTGDVTLHSILPYDSTTRIALMYGISLIALAVAVFSWKRMEA